jgi:hypothetical protein
MANRRPEYIRACLIALLFVRELAADSSRLLVRICNFSRADSILAPAEAVAQQIFQDAGIETEWITANDPGTLDPSTLTVQIFGGRARRSSMQDAFGIAFTAERESASFLANVFFGNIEETATTRKEAAVLLGHVMAHEVGHLLLGQAHTRETIMAETLGRRDILDMQAGRLRFNRRQSERLRAAVALRQRVR